MSIFDKFFKIKPRSEAAAIAKERLSIVVSHRTKKRDPDFIQKMHKDLVAVISKYVDIDPEHIRVQLGQEGDCSVLELNVTLPTSLKNTVTDNEEITA